jgi:hypothetical protein
MYMYTQTNRKKITTISKMRFYSGVIVFNQNINIYQTILITASKRLFLDTKYLIIVKYSNKALY